MFTYWGRTGGGGRLSSLLAALCLVFAAVAGGARAEEPAVRATVVVFGDSQAQGLAKGLQRVLIEDSRFRVLNRTHPGTALVHDESEWLSPIREFVAHDKADIAIVMLGANDRLDMADPESGTTLRFRTEAWRDAYASRADQILAALTAAGLKVIWCGNPIARSETYSSDMGYINDILRDRVEQAGARFLPLWDAIVDDQGRFTAYAKDRDGITRRLRTDDGIHFTPAGYELIANRIVGLLPTADAPTP